jgi:ornithine decarboxylase
MSLSAVESAYHRLNTALPSVTLHYAMKSNPGEPVLRRLHELGCQFEVASFPELAALMRIGVDPHNVLFSNPVKPPEHIRKAAEAGLWRFAADSSMELRKLAKEAPGCAVYLRLRPGSDNSSHVLSEGKFGVEPDQAMGLLHEAVSLELQPYGLSFHVGSQMIHPSAWTTAIKRCSRLMQTAKDEGIILESLNLGGGFPAHYSRPIPELSEYGSIIRKALFDYLPYGVELLAEPGRALAAEAGTMVATVIGIAERGPDTWLHLDVGAFNGLMEALETQNQLRYPISDDHDPATEQRLYHLTGPSCDSQDTILYDVPLSAELTTGDRVYLRSAGAYTTVYAAAFNGFAVPEIRYID